MFKKKTEIHAVPTETATGLALKQSLEPITQITKSLKENRKSLIEEEMQTASQISDIQGPLIRSSRSPIRLLPVWIPSNRNLPIS